MKLSFLLSLLMFFINPVLAEDFSPMGGVEVTPQGTTFRVWAPLADEVYVTGSFNEWNFYQYPMELIDEDKKIYETFVPGAKHGDKYEFLFYHDDGHRSLKSDPFSAWLEHETGSSLIYDQNHYQWKSGEFTPAPLSELIIYEIHVGSFHRIPGKRNGTFMAIAEKLPHLKELGINAIQLMPIAEFPQKNQWGYEPVSFFAVESGFGTPDDLKRLVDRAHQLGIAVLFDWVINHVSPRLGLMFDFSGFGNLFFFDHGRIPHPAWGPRPDFSNPMIRHMFRQNLRFWLGDFRLDGIRWDDTLALRSYNRDGQRFDVPGAWQTMQELNRDSKALFPGKIQIAEDLQGNSWMTKKIRDGGAGFDTQWDNGFFWRMRENLLAPTEKRSMSTVCNALNGGYNGNHLERVIYMTNHDHAPFYREQPLGIVFDPENPSSQYSRLKNALTASLLLTAPGVPMLFQGQEFMDRVGLSFSEPSIVNWSLLEKNRGMFNLYRDLIGLRSAPISPLAQGRFQCTHVNDHNKVVSYRRFLANGHEYVILANFSETNFREYRIGLAGKDAELVFASNSNTYYPDFFNAEEISFKTLEGSSYDRLPHTLSVNLAPYQFLIFDITR